MGLRHTPTFFLAVSVAMCLCVAGCGGDDSSPGATRPSAAAGDPPRAATTAPGTPAVQTTGDQAGTPSPAASPAPNEVGQGRKIDADTGVHTDS